jgi:ribosome maturation factor RimP
MPSPPSTADLHGIDRVALARVVDPIVRAHGAEVVDVEFRTERGGWVLRISVERAGSSERHLSTRDAAVNLELCANVSRDLSPALDVADLIHHPYQLEVSSPGVERVLRDERDFARFAGHKAKLKLREPIGASPEGVGGQRVVIGMLDGIADGRVRVVESGHTREVPLAIVERARLVFEFGSSGRTDKRKH